MATKRNTYLHSCMIKQTLLIIFYCKIKKMKEIKSFTLLTVIKSYCKKIIFIPNVTIFIKKIRIKINVLIVVGYAANSASYLAELLLMLALQLPSSSKRWCLHTRPAQHFLILVQCVRRIFLSIANKKNR